MKIARIRLEGDRTAYAAVEPDGYRIIKGDTVTVEIEGIGALSNKVINQQSKEKIA